MSKGRRLALLMAGLFVVADGIYQYPLWSMVDFAVYRLGGVHVLHGTALYGPTRGLPFTYPPFAAVLFVPLALLGTGVGQAVMLVLSATCYVGFVLVCACRSGLSWWSTGLAGVLGLAFEPVLHTMGLGQVNLVLGLMVVVDCLVVSDRWRGLLVGVAIGVKLTPVIFLLYFAVQRDSKAIVRGGASAALTIAVAWLIDSRDSMRYWTELFYNPDHVGRVAYPFNQSVFGALARFSHTTTPSRAAYLSISAMVLILALVACSRTLSLGDEVGALVSVAVGGLLISPISWTHHWIWLLPAGWVLLSAGRPVLAALVTAVPIIAPLRYIPTPKEIAQLDLNWFQSCVALTYTAAGLCFLVAMSMPRKAAPASHRRQLTAHRGA